MELSLNKGLFALNPRRIIYIEHYKTPTQTAATVAGLSPHMIDKYKIHPNDLSGKIVIDGEEYEINDFLYEIIIHMTDEKELKFKTDDKSQYEELRDKLSYIVGG